MHLFAELISSFCIRTKCLSTLPNLFSSYSLRGSCMVYDCIHSASSSFKSRLPRFSASALSKVTCAEYRICCSQATRLVSPNHPALPLQSDLRQNGPTRQRRSKTTPFRITRFVLDCFLIFASASFHVCTAGNPCPSQ